MRDSSASLPSQLRANSAALDSEKKGTSALRQGARVRFQVRQTARQWTATRNTERQRKTERRSASGKRSMRGFKDSIVSQLRLELLKRLDFLVGMRSEKKSRLPIAFREEIGSTACVQRRKRCHRFTRRPWTAFANLAAP